MKSNIPNDWFLLAWFTVLFYCANSKRCLVEFLLKGATEQLSFFPLVGAFGIFLRLRLIAISTTSVHSGPKLWDTIL